MPRSGLKYFSSSLRCQLVYCEQNKIKEHWIFVLCCIYAGYGTSYRLLWYIVSAVKTVERGGERGKQYIFFSNFLYKQTCEVVHTNYFIGNLAVYICITAITLRWFVILALSEGTANSCPLSFCKGAPLPPNLRVGRPLGLDWKEQISSTWGGEGGGGGTEEGFQSNGGGWEGTPRPICEKKTTELITEIV